MAIIKISATANDGEDVEKGESSFRGGGNVNWFSVCGGHFGGSLEN